ncbi:MULTISPECIES: glucoamylase family protein [unclassified Rhodanobacter]|uniref:glucoamylase family protein n=1 Tax=unclassified Rhodanobacter TaxID=2621553 RepID=UPI001BDECD6A|nr:MULTISPECIES: glucoamylase family protein [unclassified Rhodanobacter]MBT2144157.1 Tat pathway signal protein [Rhodanobacter sp. LX-99]MBT2150176.1 Tat pathway signal protein [Rhodanobacter sp. LX-100]
MSKFSRILHAVAFSALLAFGAGWQTPVAARSPALGYAALPAQQQALVDDLERRTFDWFWQSADPQTGLVPDSYPGQSFSSIAAVGFGLTAYGVGVERGYITRAQAAARTLATLRFFAAAPQNDSEDDAAGYHGFFYHFLDMKTGRRAMRYVELSSVDTTLLLGGVLFAQSYYDRDTPQETEIRQLADTIYRRVDWPWMQPRKPLISMGWTPGGKFIPADWKGYNEGMLVYILALGSPTHPVGPEAWTAWLSTNHLTWGSFQGQTFLNFAPLFGHQYSQGWVDFRGIRDAWSREHDLDYFENSRRATYAQRSYAIANPGHWTGYGANVWGLTASNGPGGLVVKSAEGDRTFHGYTARGVGLDYISDDGTIAPTAAAGSIAFAPEIVVPALETMKQRYGKYIYGDYGFVDAFNLSFHTPTTLRTGRLVPGLGWVDTLQLGIDQGPIVLMIENWRSGFVWNVMKKNPYIRKGLERAGFEGGWLTRTPEK